MCMKKEVRILLDCTPLEEKINQLISYFESTFPKCLSDDLCCELLRLSNDILPGELTTALATDGTLQIIQRVDFGPGFDDFTAALRARERNV